MRVWATDEGLCPLTPGPSPGGEGNWVALPFDLLLRLGLEVAGVVAFAQRGRCNKRM